MADPQHPIHQDLAERVDVSDGVTVLDLGCGRGGTLRAVADRTADVRLLGLDVDEDALSDAERLLRPCGADVSLRRWDLGEPIPVEDGSVDVVVCHNVLECLTRPERLLGEARQVLRPGGQAIWSHTDFAGIVIGGPDVDLTVRVVHAYATTPQPWMDHADGYMGRKLPGLVRGSGLVVEEVDVHVTVSAELTGQAAGRVREMVAVLFKAARAGSGPLTAGQVEEWSSQVEQAAHDGAFFFAEPAVVVDSRRHREA